MQTRFAPTDETWADTGDRFNTIIDAASACQGTPKWGGVGAVRYYGMGGLSQWGTMRRLD